MGNEIMDEWVFRQEIWTDLVEQVAEECVVTLRQIFKTDSREYEIRDASILLAQLILTDAANRYWGNKTGQHISRGKEAQKKIKGTAHGFLKDCDQAEYLQEFSRQLSRHAQLGYVPVDDYREIIFIATGMNITDAASFVSDLFVKTEHLSTIAYSQFKKTAQSGISKTGSVTPRFQFQFSDVKKRPGVSTQKAHKRKPTLTVVP